MYSYSIRIWSPYPLVIKHSHGIDDPFLDGLPITNGDFPVRYVSHNQMEINDLDSFHEYKLYN